MRLFYVYIILYTLPVSKNIFLERLYCLAIDFRAKIQIIVSLGGIFCICLKYNDCTTSVISICKNV